jgi:hypothetical protein
MKQCKDDRVCCYRDKESGECTILYSTYKESGACPFGKEKDDDIAINSKASMASLAKLEKLIQKKLRRWKLMTGRWKPYDLN